MFGASIQFYVVLEAAYNHKCVDEGCQESFESRKGSNVHRQRSSDK